MERGPKRLVLLLSCLNILASGFFSINAWAASPSQSAETYPPQSSRFNAGMLIPSEIDVGFMLGYTAGSRTGTINSTVFSNPPPTNFTVSSSNAQSNGEVGLQLKAIYDVRRVAQPFIYLNATSEFGSSHTMNVGFANSAATGASQLVLSYEWLAHFGVGVQTEPLYDQFQLGVGVGGALVDQKLKAYIAESTTTWFQNENKSIQPSFMGIATWQACKTCISNRPLSLSLQVSVDRNPSIASNGATVLGNTYNTSVGQKWIPHGDIVLNIPWF